MKHDGAIVSSFPIGDQLTLEQQDDMRRRLAAIKKPGSESTLTLSQEHITKAVEFLAAHPAHIPQDARMYLLQDLVAQDYNTAITMLAADFEMLQERNPATAYACRIVVDAWLIANGLRAVKWDEKVTENIRLGRETRKKGFFRRWMEDTLMTDGQKQTALIHETLDLAKRNEALRLENHRLATRNQDLATRADTVLEQAAQEAQRIRTDANAEARQIIDRARSEADRHEREAQRRVDKLQIDLGRLEQAKQDLLTNQPGLASSVEPAFEEYRIRIESIPTRLRLIQGYYRESQSLEAHLMRTIEVLSRILELLDDAGEVERMQLLPVSSKLPEINLRVSVSGGHISYKDIIDSQHLRQFLMAASSIHIRKEELLEPFRILTKDLGGKRSDPTYHEHEIQRAYEKFSGSLKVLAMKAASL